MRVTDATRSILRSRRDMRDMEAKGYERIDGPWQILRGHRAQQTITDIAISADGKGVWVKTAIRGDAT